MDEPGRLDVSWVCIVLAPVIALLALAQPVEWGIYFAGLAGMLFLGNVLAAVIDGRGRRRAKARRERGPESCGGREGAEATPSRQLAARHQR